jgi:hypothetical protein
VRGNSFLLEVFLIYIGTLTMHLCSVSANEAPAIAKMGREIEQLCPQKS